VAATDAGRMEIEWEETAVWSVAEAVRESTAEEAGSGLGQEKIVEDALRKLRMEFCSELKRRETEYAERQFVPNCDGLTGSEWCADRRRPRADEWRSNGARCGDG
jgi:hypothetical protein